MLRTQAPATPYVFACPQCRNALDDLRCGRCDVTYTRDAGIWRLMAPARVAAYERFEREYLTVRQAEGWGSHEATYYRALPFEDRTARFTELWRIRAASFRELLHALNGRGGLRVLDLGAGNCWLSYQLARRGHTVAAIDIQVDTLDGLGAYHQYDVDFVPLQAEFDRLPLAGAQADLAIFNGALHYSTDYVRTVSEALRVLDSRGMVAILDTPMYRSEASGRAMVNERQARFERSYGFTSDALPNQHFLTPQRLADLGRAVGIEWRITQPFPGWRRAIVPWWSRLRGGREPATFPVVIGRRA